MADITMARVYLTEADKMLNAIMSYLHNEANVHGVTVLRAHAGYGASGAIHSADNPSMTNNLPLMLEFFDEKEKIGRVVEHLKTMLGSDHVVTWPVVMP